MNGRASLRALMYESSYRRIESRLVELPCDIEPVLLGGDQHWTANGRPVPAATDCEFAWLSPEVFIDGLLPVFMDPVLRSPGLRWLQSGSAGYDHPLLQAVLARGIRLTVNSAPATSIAEYVFATVLDHFEDGPRRRAAQAARRWEQGAYREIAGTTWLIVGMGAIGSRVAKRAQAFEATVIGVSRSGAPLPWAHEVHAPDRLLEQLPRADIVVLALPLMPVTERLVSDAFLAAMKPGSVLVNVARGGIVDDAALIRALDRGTPAHAILDVFAREPLPADSPYWGHPRVALTSHLSGMGSGLVRRSDGIFLDNLRRYAAGEALAGVVPAPAARTGIPA
jgi:phosphoglycerate dehydrogenase-like enzyme